MATNALPHLPLIEHYLDLKRYAQAFTLIHQGLADAPEDADLHFLGAKVCYLMDRYPEAEEHLQSAFKFGYSPIEIHYLLGHIHMEQARWKQAEQAFLDALALGPRLPRVLAGYGALLLKVGERERGMAVMNEASRLGPDDAEVLRHRMYYDIARNHNNSLVMNLEKYMQSEDDEVRALVHLGIHETYQGKHRAARKHYREAYARNPTNPALLHNVRINAYKTNPLLFPVALSDRIGGLPFLFFWLMLIILCVYPFQEQTASWTIRATLLLVVYLYFAKWAVNLHQEALDTGEPYWKALWQSGRIIQLLGLLAAVLILIATYNAIICLLIMYASRKWAQHIKKKRS